MAKGFNKIWWGFLFVFIDLRCNQIDLLLPDFIGYIFITFGLIEIATYRPEFKTAKLYSILMIFFSLFDFIKFKQPISENGDLTFYIDPLFPIAFIASILHILFIWNYCNGLSELAKEKGNNSFSVRIINIRNLALILEIVSYLLLFITFFVGGFVCLIFIPVLVIGILNMIQLMMITSQASEYFSNG